MTQDETRVFFWKERKKIRRNETNECLTIKNNDGKREFNPEILLNVTASFYENLYAKDDFRPHNHHNKVKSDLETFISDHSYDMEWYNAPPTENEIKNIIENKKNKKASTDLRNELLKNSKEQFSKVLMLKSPDKRSLAE